MMFGMDNDSTNTVLDEFRTQEAQKALWAIMWKRKQYIFECSTSKV